MGRRWPAYSSFYILFLTFSPYGLITQGGTWQGLGKPPRAYQLYESINITSASCLTVNINIESTDARLINYIIFEAKTTAGSIFLLIFLASCSSANSPGRPGTVRHQAVLIRHDRYVYFSIFNSILSV